MSSLFVKWGGMIRKARAGDAAAIARVRKESVEVLCRDHYSAAQIAVWAAPGSLPPFEEILRDTLLLVWEQDGGIRGFGQLEPATGEILSVFVAPEYARRGIGRRLLAALEAAARAGGLTRVQVHASLNAVPFYESQGYRRRGLCAQVLPDGGTRIECTLMDKVL